MLGHCNSRQSNNFPASPPKMNTKSRCKILFMLAIKMKYSLSFLPAETFVSILQPEQMLLFLHLFPHFSFDFKYFDLSVHPGFKLD